MKLKTLGKGKHVHLVHSLHNSSTLRTEQGGRKDLGGIWTSRIYFGKEHCRITWTLRDQRELSIQLILFIMRKQFCCFLWETEQGHLLIKISPLHVPAA